MIVIKYSSRKHKEIIKALAHALKKGKTVVYATDTSYGLACDVTNRKALELVYKIKGRGFNKPMHIIVPSLAYAKKITVWNSSAALLAQKFLPGALTLVLPIKNQLPYLKRLGAGTGTIGLRLPDQPIALDLARQVHAPITATSANRSGGPDSYTIKAVTSQFENQDNKPDIVLDSGRLPKRKPSTVVRASDNLIKVLRSGPITVQQIKRAVASSRARVLE
jgi:L-threonylcarbamoyladenylate synthase